MRFAKSIILTVGFLIAALVAVAPLAPVSTAEASGKSNPFAGRFVGDVPRDFWGSWSININGGGKITGTIYADSVIFVSGSFTGTVDRAGRMRCSGFEDWGVQGGSGSVLFSFTADATPNSDGDIVGVTDTGESFTWFRQ